MKDVIVFAARLFPPILTGTLAGAGVGSVLHLHDRHRLLAMLVCAGLALVLHHFVRAARWLMMTGTVAMLALAIGQYSVLCAGLLGVGFVLWLALRAGNGYGKTRQPTQRPVQQAAPRSGAPHAPGQATPQRAYSLDERVLRARFAFDAITGMADTKNRLLNAARDILAHPAQARNGILLSGEPGNGKTMFAEALAGELRIPFFSVSYQDIASKWVNETPERVKAAFAQATQLGQAVFLIDEVDGFIKSRTDSHHMDRDLTNTMLTEIVRLRGTRIILVAATNDLDWLDGAAVREGRFDFKIEVPPPDAPAREALLSRTVFQALGPNALSAPVLRSLAARWEGFSAARLMAFGPQLADMRRAGAFNGVVSFDIAMRAMRRTQGSRGHLPEKVKTVEEIIMPDASRQDLRDLAFKLQHVFNLEKLGGDLPRGLLFYGPPGTGKTQAAMSLAAASGYAFLKTTGAELLSNPSSWDKLIRNAKNLKPVIVFIDEADDVLCDRRMSGVSTVTNKVLTAIDGADGRVRDVLYIAATNHPDSLDSAAIRGGRFEQKVRFDVPSDEALATYVRTKLRLLAGCAFEVSRHTTEYLVSELFGRSIADADSVLQRVIDSAALRHLREGTKTITMVDMRSALRSTLDDN
jgi:transitional endoplasmic reticulum ATPase